MTWRFQVSNLRRSAWLLACLQCVFTFTAFVHPASGIVVDSQGHVYFIYSAHGVMRIESSGEATNIAGNRRFHHRCCTAGTRGHQQIVTTADKCDWRQCAIGEVDTRQSCAIVFLKSDIKSQRTPDEQCEFLTRAPVAAWDIATGSHASHHQSRRESRI